MKLAQTPVIVLLLGCVCLSNALPMPSEVKSLDVTEAKNVPDRKFDQYGSTSTCQRHLPGQRHTQRRLQPELWPCVGQTRKSSGSAKKLPFCQQPRVVLQLWTLLQQ